MCHVGVHNPGPKPGLGCSAFARRYSRNRVCFLFLWLVRCFSSPGSLLRPMHSGAGDPPLDGTGCPIRKSQDHRSITNFPGLIAGFHVLHRLSTPRHPPYALVRLGHADPTPANGPSPATPNRHTSNAFDLVSVARHSIHDLSKSRLRARLSARTQPKGEQPSRFTGSL